MSSSISVLAGGGGGVTFSFLMYLRISVLGLAEMFS